MKNLFDISGKKAIVTGGTRGLGYGMAEGFMEAGCEVVIVGSSDKVHQVSEEFCGRGFATCPDGKRYMPASRNAGSFWAEKWISCSRLTGFRGGTVQRNFPWRNGMR